MGNAIIFAKKSKRSAGAAANFLQYRIPSVQSSRKQLSASAKVVMIDGSFTEFKEPITVAELMMEYPQHLVCHSSAMQQQSNKNNNNNMIRLQKKAALPADVQLELGRLYYLLPASEFQGPLQQLAAGADQAAAAAVGSTISRRPAAAQNQLTSSSSNSSGVDTARSKSKEVISKTSSTSPLVVAAQILINCMSKQQQQQLQQKSNGRKNNMVTRDDTCVATQSESCKLEDEELLQELQLQLQDLHDHVYDDQDQEYELPIVSFSTPDLRSMYMMNGAAGAASIRSSSSAHQGPCSRFSNSSWKPRLETIQEVGALSRRRFRNFVTRSAASRSQVHDHLN